METGFAINIAYDIRKWNQKPFVDKNALRFMVY